MHGDTISKEEAFIDRGDFLFGVTSMRASTVCVYYSVLEALAGFKACFGDHNAETRD